MTHVEIHVFEPGSEHCLKAYVLDLLSTRARYSRVCLCVDKPEQVKKWRDELPLLDSVDIIDQQSEMPAVPFQGDIMVSLASQVSPFFSAFKHTIDLVEDCEDARESGRLRYRFYRDRGYPLRHIKVQEKESAT